MAEDKNFIQRLQLIIEKAGGQVALAKEADMSKSVISKYLRGASEPNRKRLIALAKAAQVDIGWLMHGEGGEDLVAHAPKLEFLNFYENSVTPIKLDKYVPIRERLTKRDALYPVSLYFLHHVLGVKHVNDLGAFIVHGDCMEPTLKPGEVVIVDLTKIGLVDGIHLMLDGTGIHYRRIRLPHGKDIEIYYDNTSMYETQTVPRELSDQIEIVGRVIWHGRRM